jgi:hypothetical protein
VELSDTLVHVDISKSETAKRDLLEHTADKRGFTVLAPPVDFTVVVWCKEKTVNLDKFESYGERDILLPDVLDPNKVTTAVVLEADGMVIGKTGNQFATS